MTVEAYLRRGQRELRRLGLEPGVRRGAAAAGYAGGGFLLAAAALGGSPLPVAMGAACALSGGRAALTALGSAAGYLAFWGMAGRQGLVWTAVGLALALMLGEQEESRDQPLMIPAIAAAMTALSGLVWRFGLEDGTPPVIFLLRVVAAFFSAAVFIRAARCRDAISDWLAIALGVLALARAAPLPWLRLGYVAAGAMGVGGAFPAAALSGLALDLAQVSRVPMAAVLCMSYFVRLIPFDHRWQRCAAPGFAYVLVMAACGEFDPLPIPALVLGGAIGSTLPPRPALVHRRGETGVAQVRLELGAEALSAVQEALLEREPPPIDTQAILDKVRQRACGSCSARRSCTAALGPEVLASPMDADCRKQGRLLPELRRAREQLRELQADRARQGEYRAALVQQYRFLSGYLRELADALPRRGEAAEAEFRAEVAARSRRKEEANGDRCVAFPGPGARYYVLLCDGMGTGLGAAREGQEAVRLLRRLLGAGFPAEHGLRTVNSLLALLGAGGAVTVDLAELRLDEGTAAVYKWGAAPSILLTRRGPRKIGTATPPPGLSVKDTREKAEKLSLRRGEALILLSDGVDGEDVLRRCALSPDMPPGELAARILERGGSGEEDDATAAVIRLRPTAPS